jgi:hypothetical protein
LSPACFSGGALGDAIDLEAIDRRLGFLKDNNDNVTELAVAAALTGEYASMRPGLTQVTPRIAPFSL